MVWRSGGGRVYYSQTHSYMASVRLGGKRFKDKHYLLFLTHIPIT